MSKSRAKKNRANAAPPHRTAGQAGQRGHTLADGFPKWLRSRLLRMPRLTRILLAGILALAITGAIFPLVDIIYVEYFFTPGTVIVPSLISAGIGALVYVTGWYLMVGSAGENEVSEHPALALYFVIGMAALCLDIVLIIQGFAMTDAISG